MKKMKCLFVLGVIFLTGGVNAFAASPGEGKTGFIVFAPDRGFVGNREVREAFDAFKQEYPASALAPIGSNYNGLENEYSEYIARAVSELQSAGVTDIVAIPMFLSSADRALNQVKQHLPSYAAGQTIRWASPMAESFLTAQILLDRAKALSQNPKEERLMVIGMGAMDEAMKEQMTAELKRMTGYLSHYIKFKEVNVGIYYHRDADPNLKKKDSDLDATVERMAAQKEKTLVIPFAIGPKFSRQMSVDHWLAMKYQKWNVVYEGAGVLPHPNVVTWLKRTANRYTAVQDNEVGVVVMPHGATQPWNDAVEKAITPLAGQYKIEMAYGMADVDTIEEAVRRLERQGIRRAVFVRMYGMTRIFKEETDYLLGISNNPPFNHHHSADTPPQIRTSILFETFGGYEETPEVARILLDRINEISREPEKETVILVAHGSGSDEDDNAWIAIMQKNLEEVKKMAKTPFKSMDVATVREDWPEKSAPAVARLKKMIRDGNHGGRVLLISNRLYGSGPYKAMLEGEKYEMNAKGFAPHPVLTAWLQEGIKEAIKRMKTQTTEQMGFSTINEKKGG